MWAYQPLSHRHRPEMEMLLGQLGGGVDLAFVPHSGPFSRGIHSTIFATLTTDASPQAVLDVYDAFYAGSPFVKAGLRMPTLKEIVGSNRCHIGLAVEGRQVIVTSVIDNLVKGAAGGAVQWMNRMFGLDQKEGLTSAVHGWV
jgi:N-acetyl-gamma-glutamyl-phosphate reductase